MSNLRYLISSLLLLACTYMWGQDYVYLKNGDIIKCIVMKCSEDEVFVNLVSTGKLGGLTISKETCPYNLSDVYMIKYKRRGNLYIYDDNNRKQGENQKIAKGANVIYLIEGKEIPAWDIEIQGSEIKYRQTKEKKQALSNTQIIDTDKVFMICYADGSKDIITDLSKPVKEVVAEPQPKEEVPEEPQFKVIFHTVKTGDTLTSIAKQYAVDVAELRSWNDIPATTKDLTKLKAGQQLMIQQPIK